MNKNLLDVIRLYKDNTDVKVEVYFKNGQCRELSDLSLGKDHFVAKSGLVIPFEAVTHAEIFAA